MTNDTITKKDAADLATAWGMFVRIRFDDERNKIACIKCLNVVETLIEMQEKTGIELGNTTYLRRAKSFFKMEAETARKPRKKYNDLLPKKHTTGDYQRQ